MTPREKFIKALKREKFTGHVPHFELVFFLTMESIGKVHPSHRNYGQWNQMSKNERKQHIRDIALCHTEIAEKYNHFAIFVHPNPHTEEVMTAIHEEIRELSGDKYFLLSYSDPTLSIPNGNNMVDFSVDLYERPEKIHEQLKRNLENEIKRCDFWKKHGGLVDGFGMCSDYCFNVNCFFTPELFDEFITPYLSEIIAYFRSSGFYSIKHTDGNINGIVQKMVDCKPDAIHSIDPQGGVDLKTIKKQYGDKVCLIGNVNCGLMQTGTIEEMEADVRRSLRDGMEGGYGYIFSTSNCVFTGLELDRYEKMHKIWREEGIYK
ncbi:MAG: hypothetical protein FWD23_07965 [Oscillospiraceae bacterium]|nr:hypothetical protein [Oscillospiraceae bacterium]